MLKFFVKLFNAINSNSNPGEIAHAISIAMILGFMPKNNAFWYVLAVFFLFVRINKGALMLFTALFSLLAPSLDGVFDQLGYAILTIPQMQGFYATLIDIPFVAFTKFNNTIVMGSLVGGLILYIPIYIISRLITFFWRAKLVPVLRKTKLIMFIKKIPLVSRVSEISDIVRKEI